MSILIKLSEIHQQHQSNSIKETIMNNITDKLIEAQNTSNGDMSRNRWLSCISRDSTTIRYKKHNRWLLPSCQSVYQIDDTSVVQQGTPLISGTQKSQVSITIKIISAIRTDQQGLTTFPNFCKQYGMLA